MKGIRNEGSLYYNHTNSSYRSIFGFNINMERGEKEEEF